MTDVVLTDGAPKPIGPYNQAVVSGGFVWCSGQVGLDPKTGALVAGGVAAESRRVLQNLSAVLEAAGSSLGKVVRCTVFLKNLGDFAAMNEVYAQFFTKAFPSRSTVEVARLPKDALVEIDCIATK
jgi:2-iminobutanoate/2-iminopropanoate deaminase